MEKYGFIYIWRDRKHNRYYIGSHWGKEDDGYVCSSKWMRDSYRRRPQDFSRKTLGRIFSNKKELLLLESRWLSLILDEQLGKKYYNLRKIANSNGLENSATSAKISKALTGRKMPEETKLKISQALMGHQGYWKGRSKPMSEETAQKIGKSNSVSLKGKKFSEERKQKLAELRNFKGENHPMYGKHHSEETRQKISLAGKGRIPWNKGLVSNG